MVGHSNLMYRFVILINKRSVESYSQGMFWFISWPELVEDTKLRMLN